MIGQKSRFWLGLWGVLCPVCLFLSPAQAAANPDYQRLNYEVYAGGFDVVSASLYVEESKDRYSFSLDAGTHGFLAKLVPWEGTFETHGWKMKDKFQPELHRSTATSSDGSEIKNYYYGKNGSFKKYSDIENGKEKSPGDIDPALVKDTTDALSATLAVMTNVAKNGACEGSSEVFDGDRRYRLVFHHDAEEVLQASSYNTYAGPATRCTVEVQPAGGKWWNKPRGWLSIQEQGRKAGSLPTVWMAQIDKKGPAVPVKVRIKTDYGTLFAHMVDYKNHPAPKTEKTHAE